MSQLDRHDADSIALLGELLDRLPGACHLRVHACYHRMVPAEWGFRDRVNEDEHLIFIKSGEGAYTVGDVHIPFERGRIIFVSRGMQHSASQHAGNPPVIIPVRFGIYRNDTGEPLDGDHRPFSFSFVPNAIFEFQQLFEKLYDCCLDPHPYSQQLSGITLSEVMLKCGMERLKKSDSGMRDAPIERVKRRMDQAPHLRHSSEQLAGMAGLSEKVFRTMYKKQYGLTPMAYQTKIRMEHARFLLLESGQSINQVALSMGYPDQFSFSKQFKLWFGCSPSQARSVR